MNTRVWAWTIIVALGGFLFGFDTAVISGVTDLLREEWSLSNVVLGQVVAAALYGTIIGAVFGGVPADRYGRRTSLIGIALLFLASAIGSALAPDATTLAVARFVGGLGVGASSVVAPLYITEVSPAAYRGRLVAAFQFNLVIGILLAYFSNFAVDAAGLGDNWRLMLGIEILPAVLFVVLLFRVPRSPRWLITKAGQTEEARSVLHLIDPTTADEEVRAISRAEESEQRVALGTFFSKKYARPIVYAFLFGLFNQVSGINAVIYYAPDIFQAAGLGRSSALLSSVGIGVINVLFTGLGMYLIDRAGRRRLMYIGTFGYLISLSAIAYAFYSDSLAGYTVPVWTFVFIASHAIGQGAVIWVFISEIFTNEVRGLGASLGSTSHWIFAAIIGGNFPLLAATFGNAGVFAFFACCMVGQLIFVHFFMPETKGKRLERAMPV